MSDFPQGTDWWKASDGRWYAPPASEDGEPPTASASEEFGPDWWEATDKHWYPPPVRTDRSPPPGQARGAAASTGSGNGCLWMIGIVIVLFVVFAAIGSGGDDGGSGGGAPSGDEIEFGAFDVCTQFVEDRLKAPGSASFRNYYEDDREVTVIATGDSTYRVASSVDAENSFGATLRTNFVCTVRHAGGDSYRLVNLDMN